MSFNESGATVSLKNNSLTKSATYDTSKWRSQNFSTINTVAGYFLVLWQCCLDLDLHVNVIFITNMNLIRNKNRTFI